MAHGHGTTPTVKTRASYHARLARERQERVDKIHAQIQAGTLTVRKLTEAEREAWGPPKNLTPPRGLRNRKSLRVPHEGDVDFVIGGEAA